jgi:hypothetical protein
MRRSRGHAVLRRRFCASSMDAFQDKLHRGLGVPAKLRALQAPVCGALFARGWCTVDGLLNAQDAALARAEASEMYADGVYSPSYSLVEETGEKLWRPNVHMMELGTDSWRTAPTIVVLLSELMAGLPDVVNDGFLKLDTTGHQHPLLSSRIFGHKLAASTASGARYPKHLDNVTGGADKRKLTAVYYMNAGVWDAAAHGGAIRLYDGLPPDAPGGAFTDVPPVGDGGVADRLLLFWSDLLVHEVLPMHAPVGAATAGDSSDARHHRHTFTLWLTSENDGSLLDEQSPLYPLRVAHYPERRE